MTPLVKAEAGFGVRHEDRLDAAHDDLVRTGTTFRELPGAGRAEDLVHGDGVHVTDAGDVDWKAGR